MDMAEETMTITEGIAMSIPKTRVLDRLLASMAVITQFGDGWVLHLTVADEEELRNDNEQQYDPKHRTNPTSNIYLAGIFHGGPVLVNRNIKTSLWSKAVLIP